MLKLSVVELFLRLIPEGFLFMFAGYVFSKVPLNKGRFVRSSIMLAIVGYLIRLLPINFGVHSILAIIAFITLSIVINKISSVKSIIAAIIIFITQFTSEFISFIIMKEMIILDINGIMSNPIKKLIFGMPSLAMTACIVGMYYFILLKRNQLKRNLNTSDF